MILYGFDLAALKAFKWFVMSGAVGVVAESMHVVGDGIIPEVSVRVAPSRPAATTVAHRSVIVHAHSYSACTSAA